jgi:pilin isopeptide linkage protein
MAWGLFHQNSLSADKRTVADQPIYLQKYEKDVDGNPTTVPVPDAIFSLYQVTAQGDVQIGGQYTTDQLGQIKLSLKPGQYYFEEESPAPSYANDTDSSGQEIRRYYFTVTTTSDDQQPIVIVYNVKKSGDLDITKTVKMADGSQLTDEQKDAVFEFIVTFSDGGTYNYRIDGGPLRSLTSGESLFLKHGQHAVFGNLPQGVRYTVVEVPKDHYTVSSTNSVGTIHNQPSLVEFVNTYDDDLGTLEVSKEVVNDDGSALTDEQKDLEFTFKIIFSAQGSFVFTTNYGQSGVLSSGDTFTLKHGEIMTIKLPEGVTYEVTETQPIPSDYLPSPSGYFGTVVEDVVTKLPFINHYQPGNLTDEGAMSFEKVVKGQGADPNQEFEFKVTFSDGGTYEYQIDNGPLTPLASGGTILIKAGQKVAFPTLPARVGYTIEEVNVPSDYRPSPDKVTGVVVPKKDQHHVFTNYYEPDSELIVEKEGDGAAFDPDKVFEFTVWINDKFFKTIYLKAGDKSVPIPVKKGDTWRVEETDYSADGYYQTSLINGQGTVDGYGLTIIVKQVNTCIKDVKTTIKGKKTWDVPAGEEGKIPQQIIVRLMYRGHIVAEKVVTGPNWDYSFDDVPKYDKDGNEIPYYIEEVPINDFYPEYPSGSYDIINHLIKPIDVAPPIIEKVIEGDKPQKDVEFEFVMNPGNQIVKIKGQGKISFKAIQFSKPGTYEFSFTEKMGDKLGYTYDKSQYLWRVRVESVSGKLVVTKEEVFKNGQSYNGNTLIFRNRFDQEEAAKEPIKIPGKKTWNFKDLPEHLRPKEIVVYLYANGVLVYEKTVSLDDEWKYEFNVPKYDEHGKLIVYTIKEKPVPGFDTTYDGYNILNTYNGKVVEVPPTPSAPEEPSKPSQPSTPPSTTKPKKPGVIGNFGEGDNLVVPLWGVVIIEIAGALYVKKKRNER